MANKEEWMSKCVPHFINKGHSQKQAVAACVNMFDKGDLNLEVSTEGTVPSIEQTKPVEKPAKTKVDMLTEIKKLLQKNNMSIDDDTLLALVEKIQTSLPQTNMSFIINDNKLIPMQLELQQIQATSDNQDVLALPFGKHYVITRNYEGWIDFNEKLFKNIITNYNNTLLSKPYIDINHERDQACGLLSNPRIEKDGLHIDFQLNELGLDLVKKGVYNYISPTITDFKDGQGKIVKDWLATISLVNSPALLGAIPMLSEQLSLSLNLEKKRGNKKMSEIMLQNSATKLVELSVKLNKPLNLAGEINPEAIAAKFPDIVKLIEDLSAMITELTGQKDQAQADAKTAKDAADAVNQQMSAILNEQKKTECESVITDAVKFGIYIPNEKFIELKKAEFMRNPDSIKEEIKILKSTISTGQTTFTGVQQQSTGIELKLTDDEKAEIKDLGYDIEKDKEKLIAAGYGKGV